MKNRKRFRFGLSKTSAILCFIAVSTATTTFIPAFADTKLSTQTEVESQSIINTSDNAFIIDSKDKIYFDFNKGMRMAGFNFKVPDYAVNGYSLDKSLYLTKENSNQYSIEISFSPSSESSSYSFLASPISIKDLLKNDNKSFSNDRMQLQSTEKSIGSTKGEEIEVITTDLNGNVNLKSTIKYFTWKDNGVYYAIRFYEFIRDDIDTKGTVHTEINDDEISKIINSLKEPKQTNVINYLEKRNHEGTDSYTDRYIYDKDDLKEAENTLGFKPVLIKNSTLIPEVASVRYKYEDEDEKEKARLLFDTDYKFGDGFHLHLIQSKDKTIYDKVVNNEYYFSSSKMKDGMDITTDKLKINDIDVYKVKLSINNSTKEYRYTFERNGVYYELKNLNNKDDASTEASLEQAIKFILNEK